MEYIVNAWCSTIEDYHIQLRYIVPKVCPLCSTSYAQSPEYVAFHNLDQARISAAAIFFCPACEGYFLEKSVWGKMGNELYLTSRSSFPIAEHLTEYSDRIKDISSNFIKYFNEAEIAENRHLTGICGMGYRKSLEFLIKDYAIYLKASKDEVEKASLSECINKYIDEPRIKATALASAWIGNDETHYLKKYEDKTLTDLKDFIEGVVYYIEMDSRFRQSKDFIDSNGKNKS